MGGPSLRPYTWVQILGPPLVTCSIPYFQDTTNNQNKATNYADSIDTNMKKKRKAIFNALLNSKIFHATCYASGTVDQGFFHNGVSLKVEGQAWCSGESCLTESPGRGFEAASP